MFSDAVLTWQPFTGADNQTRKIANNPLLILRDLNNRDKHRFQVPAVIASLRADHSVSVSFGSDADAAVNTPPDTEIFTPDLVAGDGLLLRYRATRPIESVGGAFGINAQARIEICDGRKEGITTLLGVLIAYVDQVVQSFGGARG